MGPKLTQAEGFILGVGGGSRLAPHRWPGNRLRRVRQRSLRLDLLVNHIAFMQSKSEYN